MAVVAASNSTHFLFNGIPYPKGWEVVGFSTNAAVLKREDFRDLYVSPTSNVGGVVPADQAALVAALEAIVDSVGAEDTATAADINTALKATPQPVTADKTASATVTAVASGTSSVQALAANTNRKGVLAFNTDDNFAYLKYGTAASTTSFTVRIPSGGYWEMPQPLYTGVMHVIWDADGSGSLVLTEV